MLVHWSPEVSMSIDWVFKEINPNGGTNGWAHFMCDMRAERIYCVPCSPPRAAHSHSSSVGSLLPFQRQKAWASFQLTWTTGKSNRSRMPEPGPAGWAVRGSKEGKISREHAGRDARNLKKIIVIIKILYLSPKHPLYGQPPRSGLKFKYVGKREK